MEAMYFGATVRGRPITTLNVPLTLLPNSNTPWIVQNYWPLVLFFKATH